MLKQETVDDIPHIIFIDYLKALAFTNVPFLEVNISLTNDRNICTDLYTKPTDKHQHLLYCISPPSLHI